MNLYVGNLPYQTTEDDLREMFSEHGNIKRANIIMDRETGQSKGFGFVEYASASEGQAAIEALNGHSINGRSLRVNEARPRENKPRFDRGPR